MRASRLTLGSTRGQVFRRAPRRPQNWQCEEEISSPERRLWCDVVLVAIRDALDCPVSSSSTAGKGAQDLDMNRARDWFSPHNPDYREVCWLAGIEYERLAKQMQAAIKAVEEQDYTTLQRRHMAENLWQFDEKPVLRVGLA